MGDVMVLTVMRFDPDRAANAPAPEPALDMNMDLLERRTAMRVFFNRHDPRTTGSQAHASVLGMSSTSQSVTEDSTDASASFHSGALTEDLDVDVGLALDLDPIHTTASGQGTQTSTSTTTTTVPSSRSRRGRSRSSGPRSSNLVSSVEDIWVAHLRIFAVCGNCRPQKVTVAASARLAEILAHFTTVFADMRVIPDAARERVHWMYDGSLAIFLLTGWGSLEPRSVAVWIEPGHRWQEPFVTSIPNHASRAQILACIRLPGLDAAVITIDGVIWDGLPRFFHNGEVLQLRSSWHHLGSLPTHLVSDRVLGLLALHCGYHGPTRVRQDPLHGPALARHSRQHFDICLRSVMERFLPSVTCNNIFLVVQTGPFLYLSLGTRLPPCVEDVQMFYDDFIMPMHGPRCIEDAKMVWEDACIFLARTPEFPCSLWLLLGTPSLDVIQLDSGQDLSQWPAPPGRVWFPGETKGNVGIAFLQNIDSVGECPGPPRLAHISVRPPWPAGVPHVSFSDDEVHGCTHSVHSLFGSSSPEAEDVHISPVTQNDPARSSWEPAGANPRAHEARDGAVPEDSSSSSASSSSSSGVVLLQQRLEFGKDIRPQPKQELLRRIPTPCRSFKLCPSVQGSNVQTHRLRHFVVPWNFGLRLSFMARFDRHGTLLSRLVTRTFGPLSAPRCAPLMSCFVCLPTLVRAPTAVMAPGFRLCFNPLCRSLLREPEFAQSPRSTWQLSCSLPCAAVFSLWCRVHTFGRCNFLRRPYRHYHTYKGPCFTFMLCLWALACICIRMVPGPHPLLGGRLWCLCNCQNSAGSFKVFLQPAPTTGYLGSLNTRQEKRKLQGFALPCHGRCLFPCMCPLGSTLTVIGPDARLLGLGLRGPSLRKALLSLFLASWFCFISPWSVTLHCCQYGLTWGIHGMTWQTQQLGPSPVQAPRLSVLWQRPGQKF